MSNFKSRLFAYILDMLIISLALNLISGFFTQTDNLKKLDEELNDLTDKYMDNEIDFKTFIYNEADISRDIDKQNIYINLIRGFLLVGYFIILPYCNNGQTLGKKLLKIKIVSEDGELDYNKLTIRTLILNGLGSLIITMSFVYIVPSIIYLAITTILGMIETIILVVSAIKIARNEQHKGIHDILSGTKVISE